MLPPKMASKSINSLTQNIQKTQLHILSELRSEKKHVTYFGPFQNGKCSSLLFVQMVFYHIDNKADQNIMEVVYFRKPFGDICLVNSNTLCKVLVTKSYCSLYRHVTCS